MLPASFHDSTAFMEVAPATWRAVLDAAGEPTRLIGDTLTPDRLLASLTAEPPGSELSDALEAIHELGSDAGRDQLQQASDDAQFSLGSIDDVPARELAAQVWVQSRSPNAETVATVLTRARMNSPALANLRQCREFAGKYGTVGAVDKEKLEAAIKTWCPANQQSAEIIVSAFQRGDEWWYEVLRGDAVKRVVEMRDSRPRVLDYRPASSDLLRYDPATGRLAIATRSPRRLQMYRQVVGTLLDQDAEFFANENICTLRPLQLRGRAVFDHLPPEVLRVDVVELRWRRGDRGKVLLQDQDCFALVEEFGLRMTEGTLIEARLSVTFGGGGRSGSVSIKVPNRIDMNVGRHELVVERMLDEMGLRGQFDETGSQATVWSLYPWREPAQLWRKCLGLDFDALAKQKLMRTVALKSTTPPDHPAATGALAVTSISANVLVGLSEDPAIGVRTLTASDVQGYELDVARLTQKFQTDLQLVGQSREIETGVWLLGTRALCATVTLNVVLALREPSGDAERLIRNSAQGTHTVVVIPVGCHSTMALSQVQAHLHTGQFSELLASIVERLELQSIVPPPVWVRETLIIHEGLGQVWFQGELLTRLKEGSNPFRFALAVARAKGRVVKKNELNNLLSVSRTDGETARAAKRDFQRALEGSFRAAGKTPPPEAKAIFASPNHGYRLITSARVIS
jgi:hypothetical protein